jgi:hypothetical protein
MPKPTHVYEPLTSENDVLLLIDHQVGLMSGVRDYSIAELKHNVVGLAKAAKALKLPIVMTTTARDSMWGSTFPELVGALSGLQIIDRSSVNAFDDARVARAIEAVDACGTFSETKRQMGLLRMMQAGVILSDYATLMIEVLKDNGRPESGAVYGALEDAQRAGPAMGLEILTAKPQQPERSTPSFPGLSAIVRMPFFVLRMPSSLAASRKLLHAQHVTNCHPPIPTSASSGREAW